MNTQSDPFQSDLPTMGFSWLKSKKQQISKAFLQDEVTTHPDYPALTSLTDALLAGGFEFYALKGDKSSVDTYIYPLLAHIKKGENEALVLIKSHTFLANVSPWTEHWTGVVLFADESATFKDPRNDLYLAKEKRSNLHIKFGISVIAIIIAIVYYDTSSLFAATFSTLSGIGLILSLIASFAETGTQSAIVKQVCGPVKGNSCGAVLKSENAKLIAGFTLVDLSILSFAIQLLLMVVNTFINPEYHLLAAIYWASMLGLPIVAWSVYTQHFKLKRWCFLCLSIVGVLILQMAIAGIAQLRFIISIPVCSTILTTGLLALLVYLPRKSLLKSRSETSQIKNELSLWKKDAAVFNALLQNEPEANCASWLHELQLGNVNARLQITVACNPYCTPCANVHEKLDEILKGYSEEVGVKLRFICTPENKNNPHTIAVTAILQRAREVDSTAELQQMITDWFNWMDIEKWKSKWQPNASIDVSELLLQHSEWMKEEAIKRTPTLYINGKKLPSRYSIQDLIIVLPRFIEILE